MKEHPMNELPREMSLVIHQEAGMMWAEVPGLPGCFASGADIAELEEALAESISIYLAATADERQSYTVEIHPPTTAKHIPARIQLAAA